MNFKNSIFAAIIGLAFNLSNPIVAMSTDGWENKHMQRLCMIANHVNPYSAQEAESFNPAILEKNDIRTQANVIRLHKNCQREFFKKSLINLLGFVSTATFTTCLASLGIGLSLRIPLALLTAHSGFEAISSAEELAQSFGNDNYPLIVLEQNKIDLRNKIANKLRSNRELYNAYIKKTTHYKYTLGFTALSMLHWLPKERAAFSTFVGCVCGASFFYHLSRIKAEDTLYKEKAKTFSSKELSRLHHLLSHLEQPIKVQGKANIQDKVTLTNLIKAEKEQKITLNESTKERLKNALKATSKQKGTVDVAFVA